MAGEQQSSAASALAATLETALGAYLRSDPSAIAAATALSGKCIALTLSEPALTLYFLPDAKGVQVLSHYEGAVDTRLRGSPLGFARLAVDNREDALFQGAVSLEGDTETGQRFQALLAGVDIDWEEHLSRITGDVLAHQAGNAVRQAQRFVHDAGDTLAQDVGEYLQEEARILPGRTETAYFLNDVDRLCGDVDRLEARVRRLLAAATDNTP